jgi:hypothetical protein
MVQISIFAYSNLEVAEDYDTARCAEEEEEDDEEKASVLHITKCSRSADGMTIVDAEEGHYRTTPQSVRVEVQDGGNQIGAFDVWVRQFKVGERFETMMSQTAENMNCAFGPDTCRVVAAEMKAALPHRLEGHPQEPKHIVKPGRAEEAKSPSSVTSSISLGGKTGDATECLRYYQVLMGTFITASANGLFISAY